MACDVACGKTNKISLSGGSYCGLHAGVERSKAGVSLVLQWLTLCAAKAGGLSLTPGQETRSHMLQLKIPPATNKTWCSQINKIFFEKCDFQFKDVLVCFI